MHGAWFAVLFVEGLFCFNLLAGLLKLLSSVIEMMPDSLTDKVFQKSIINPKTLIVLANSGSPEIRACVIKVRT